MVGVLDILSEDDVSLILRSSVGKALDSGSGYKGSNLAAI